MKIVIRFADTEKPLAEIYPNNTEQREKLEKNLCAYDDKKGIANSEHGGYLPIEEILPLIRQGVFGDKVTVEFDRCKEIQQAHVIGFTITAENAPPNLLSKTLHTLIK